MKWHGSRAFGARFVFWCVLAQCVGCAESGAEHQAPLIASRARKAIAASPVAHGRMQNLRERFRFSERGDSILAPGPAVVFEPVGEAWIKPTFSARASRDRHAEITLPSSSQGPAHIEDSSSGIGISFAIHGTKDVPALLAENIVWYEGAGEQGESLLFRVDDQGIEDFALFEDKPAHETLRYAVDLRDVAGLRLVSNTLEMLDESGAPRLRVVAPYVLEAAPAIGSPRIHEARLTLVDCAADTRAAPPWGRPLTPICASPPCRCEMQISWEGMGVGYPAIVDPAWTTTKNMSKPRLWATATTLPDERVIVIGGQSVGVPLKTSEIFDPKDGGTWALGPEMMAPRTQHTATKLDDGTIALVGGQIAFSPRNIEVLDPAAPKLDWQFDVGCELIRYRSQHATALLSNDRLLVVGGRDIGSKTNIDSEICEFGAQPICYSHALLKHPRFGHTATMLRKDVVLIVGGVDWSGGSPQQTAEWVHPSMTQWVEAVPPQKEHYYPQATLLRDGRVLITGSSSETFTWPPGDEFPNGPLHPWHDVESDSPIERQYHQAVRLPNDKVLLTGGYSTSLRMDELFDPVGDTWSTLPHLLKNRKGHVAAVAGDYVLVAGGMLSDGFSPDIILADAEVLRLRPDGADCGVHAECKSGYCVNGRCCDAACHGDCFACTALETGSEVDGHCGVRLSNKCGGYTCGPSGDCRTSCVVDDECAELYICESDQCVQAPGICDGGMLLDRRGELVDDCGVYTCENTSPGTCRHSCSHGSHCDGGFRCVSGECVPNVAPTEAEPGACHCGIVGTDDTRAMVRYVWILFVAAYAARSRRSSRSVIEE